MANNDSKISQLPSASTGFRQGFYAKTNPTSGNTEKAVLQEDLGAVKASFAWQSDVVYDTTTNKFVEYMGQVFRSLQNSNVGNVPTENAFWTNEPISTADGITDTQYATGMFTYNDSKMIFNDIQYYLQVAAPFKSADAQTEIDAGDWAAGGTGSTGITDVSATTYTVLASDEIVNVLHTITAAVTITIPTAIITNGFNKLVVKDAGGNSSVNNITIVGEGAEDIDGQANIIIDANYSSLNLYATNSVLSIY